MCRLYVASPGEVGNYATLSYARSGLGTFPTTQATLEERLRGFPKVEMPQTLRDATEVTKRLGLRFLWIDAVCVVQDDPAEKAHAAAEIAKIFGSSFATICAASAYAAKDGFLQDKSHALTGLWRSLIPLRAAIPNADARNMQDAFELPKRAIGTVLLMDKSDMNHPERRDGVSSDPWCLQEIILSERLLFYDRWPLWRCNAAACSDGGAGLQGDNLGPGERLLSRHIHALSDRQSTSARDHFTVNQIQMGWGQLLKDYTKRKFDSGTDRLSAIGGIASMLSRSTGDEYISGLWKENLVHDLMWQSHAKEWLSRPAGVRYPTWTWASVDGPVSCDSITVDHWKEASLVSVLEEPTTVSTDHDSGRILPQYEARAVEITGPFQQVDRGQILELLNRQGMAPSPPMNGDRMAWNSLLRNFIATSVPKHRSEDESPLSETVFVLVTFTRDWISEAQTGRRLSKKCYSGLLLVRVDDDCYERVGAFANESRPWLDLGQPWSRATIRLV